MSVVRPFKGIVPRADLAAEFSCLPYDVMNRAEAKEMAAGNPNSYLRVVRSEIDLADSVGDYDEIVYRTARKNFDQFLADGVLIAEDKPVYYIYRQMMDGRVQTGIVATCSIDEYENGIIKRHEFTRPVKEVDRINNFYYTEANTEPVFFSYRKNAEIDKIVDEWIKFHKPEFDFRSEDGITHVLWKLDDAEKVKRIEELFKSVDYLYIADGHHRTASAAKVGLKKREEHPNYTGDEEFNYLMAVIFPDEDLFIMDYNRIVKDLAGKTEAEFIAEIEKHFVVKEAEGDAPYRPMKRGTFGMYLGSDEGGCSCCCMASQKTGKWYELTVKEGVFDPNDPIDRLDVSILQKNVLSPILGIEDPRTDNRIDFIGGIRGLGELEKRVAEGWKVAFSMYPTEMSDLIAIADSGNVMPPKSTWFEPKLRSGLFIHRLF
ncbi:MAG: DUF1015 family protein [Bacillota bacterium]|nr:DUF1015 family protein [Bacillota bacterium]